MKNGYESIFPKENQTTKLGDEYVTLLGSSGITKREYFSALAMQGMLANSYSNGANQPMSEANAFQIAGMAVVQSDALLAELSSNKESGE